MNKFFPYSKPESKIKYPITNLPEYDKNVDRFVGDTDLRDTQEMRLQK